MTFHQAQAFRDAIEAAAIYHQLQPIFIEKDYWVTYILKNIALSAYSKQVVFKGGTSLSKAYQCIERFSEDVDLALLKTGTESNNQLKQLIEKIEKITIQGLVYQPDSKEIKRGHIRKTYWQYPKLEADVTFPVKEHILLEINCFSTPVPHQLLEMNSYLGIFLSRNGFLDLVETHGLQPFTMQVLTRERTFYEKLLSLTRLSYSGVDKLKEKIRHFYDIYQLFQLPDLREALFEPENLKWIEPILQDDKSNPTFRGEWEDKRLSDAPIMTQFDEIWKILTPNYENEMSKLLWGKLPPAFAIADSFKKIRNLLILNQL